MLEAVEGLPLLGMSAVMERAPETQLRSQRSLPGAAMLCMLGAQWALLRPAGASELGRRACQGQITCMAESRQLRRKSSPQNAVPGAAARPGC